MLTGASVLTAAGSVFVCAALSWLGRGASQVFLGAVLATGLLALTHQALSALGTHSTWSLSWVAPIFLVLAAAVALADRRHGSGNAGPPIAIVEVLATLSSLVAALAWARVDVGSGATATRILLITEDNAAWLNMTATLRDTGGGSALTPAPAETFGPVIPTMVGLVRAMQTGLGGSPASPQDNAVVVLACLLLTVVLVPLTAAAAVRRLGVADTVVHAVLAWACLSLVLVPFVLVLASFGALSAAISAVLGLLAITLASSTGPPPGRSRTRPAGWRSGWSRWSWRYLGAGLATYAATAAWLPLVPLGAVGLVLLGLVPLVGAWWSREWAVGIAVMALSIPAALAALALFWQFRTVSGAAGGTDVLLGAGGAAPSLTVLVEAAIVGLLALCCTQRRLRPSASGLGPVLLVLAYTALVFAVDAWTTRNVPHYGSQKLWYAVGGLLLALLTVEALARSAVVAQGRGAALPALGCLLALLVFQNGPVYDAAARHWPSPVDEPRWLDTALRETRSATPVVCLDVDVAAPGETPEALPAYDCSRWSASMQGLDGRLSLDWRFTMLGRRTVADEASDLARRDGAPLIVIVLGTTGRLGDRDAWWSPLVSQPGMRFVRVAA